MPPQAPWSPTAHAFAQHQFSQVANFWKQGRSASFQLEALPGGHAKLSLTFQLPPASTVVPPPSQVLPVPSPQRPTNPLFPKGCSPQKSDADSNTKQKHASQMKVPSKQRKSYRRSVLHRAALAAKAPSLPPPEKGSLRQAALACVQRLQAVSALPLDTQSAKKRPLSNSPSAPSPLAQRIRADIHVEASEFESPERDILRSCPESSPTPMSPCTRGIPLPAPLVFTPVPQKKPSCLNCDAEMAPGHQCDATDTESDWLKCHVCECLGRKTSLVLRGSRCPSCGITAGLPSCLLCNSEPCNCQ